MKKVRSRKKQAKKRSGSTNYPTEFIINRITIFSTIAVLLIAFFILLGKRNITQDVAGISIARPLFAYSTVSWQPVVRAVTYNIYYKKRSSSDFVYAVRKIPANVSAYTISYLKKGDEYHYKISAADATGNEFWWSEMKDLPTPEPM